MSNCTAQDSAQTIEFGRLGRRVVEGCFDGGSMTSDAGVMLLGATDNPLLGQQEGRFFYGYYDTYCYLPLYVFCGQQLLCAYPRPS